MPRKVVRAAVLAAILVVALVAPAGASAALKATSKVEQASGGARLAVKLARKGSLSARRRPTAVSVKASGRTYRLRKSGGGLGTWRSAVYRGAAADRVRALAGRRIQVVVRSRSGSSTLRPTVAGAPPSTGPAPAPAPAPTAPQPLFQPAPGELSGQPAFDHISRYFINSRFTDCPPGWPACAVEERYNHCAGGGQDGQQEYHRLTPSSGSDINSYGTYHVTDAVAHPDGSWGVAYNFSGYGNTTFYSWNVAANGSVTGLYTGPSGDQQNLGPLQWQQPSGC